MVEFTIHDCFPTETEILGAIAKNGGKMMGFGMGGCCPGDCPERVGGWRILLVNRQGMGNHGTFIAVADTEETLKIQYEATVRVLRRLADAAEARNDPGFLSRGDVGCEVIPLEWSTLLPRQNGRELCRDEKYIYFTHTCGNYLRPGDDRSRIWVKSRKRKE